MEINVDEYNIILLDDDIILVDKNNNNLETPENDYIKLIKLNEDDIVNTNLTKNNNIIIFDIDNYLYKIYKSYSFDINKINNQFELDINRTTLYINNQIQLNKTLLYDYLINFKNKIYNFNNIDVNNNKNIIYLNNIIIMLCTQASYAFSYILMHNYYNNKIKGLNVFSDDTSIHLTFNQDNCFITLVANYKLVNINLNKIINNINIMTNIDICDDIISKYGIINWQIR